MRNFFESTHFDWPELHGSLHVYVFPDTGFTTAVQPAIDAIAEFDGCAAVQPRWQHATVTRIPWWHNEVAGDRLDRFTAALAAIAADSSPFALPMTGPWFHELGVGMATAEDPQWKQLLSAVRTTAAEVFGPDRPLPPPPAMPHVSLGYGIADRDSAALEHALSTIRTPATLPVNTLHFLSVHANPTEGTFTWDPISSHVLEP
ncbi:2'-5' RNA ligase family protein [Nocardia sp. NPDC051570]|uniref:2'-5' RNA ligase family protein n=1 Tax=Nocardia sp. NPDC051570 TaxID=3364324 RepID=UPI00379B586D